MHEWSEEAWANFLKEKQFVLIVNHCFQSRSTIFSLSVFNGGLCVIMLWRGSGRGFSLAVRLNSRRSGAQLMKLVPIPNQPVGLSLSFSVKTTVFFSHFSAGSHSQSVLPTALACYHIPHVIFMATSCYFIFVWPFALSIIKRTTIRAI